jgi:hypothetical protein
MATKIYRLLFILLFPLIGFSQSGSIEGKVYDTLNVKPVVFASVSLIRKADSILVKSLRTDQQGNFQFSKIKPDSYILLIAHSSFVDFVDDVELKEGENKKDLGQYNLYQRGQMLREIVIKNQAGIKIKGDTLEFLADSFKVKQGAMVEDLLKVLPGIQVNKKGEITAMGEKVEKVLVDGEEFFGDDPTVATQNIQSAVVEKVQVFDKKSDQAQFTGFDDGQEEKTINLKLKKDMNHGEFGKIELGGGLEDRWQNQAMVNSFKNKRQMSIYGLMSSNGKTGLGWEDRNKYTGDGGNMSFDEDGGFMWNFDADNEDGQDFGGRNAQQEGITKAWTGGAHYANKWNESEHHVNANYSFGRINRSKRENSFTENLLPNNQYFTRDTNSSFSSRNTHRLSGRYEFNPDSSLSIIYNLNARIGFDENNTENNTINQTADDAPINRSIRNNESNSKTARVTNRLTINRRLKKKGRTLSLSSYYTNTDNNATGFLNGINSFFAGGLGINELLDQKKEQSQLGHNLNAELTYTEPIGKKFLLKTSYAYSSDITRTKKTTLVKTNGYAEYTQRIDSLSSDFDSEIYGHTVGAEIKFNEKKYNITAGTRVRYSMFHQDDLVRNLNYDYNRVNLFPTLRFNYKFSQFSRFTFTYNGSTRQPSIQQLQPVQDNSNPLEIYVGNPDLKIGYNQVFNVNYFNYKVLTARSLYAGIFLTNNYNNISLNRTFDELGRTINQYVNLNGGYTASLWGGINAKIPKTELEGKLNLSGSLARTPNIVNNEKGRSNSTSITLTPGLAYNKEDKIYASLDLGLIYSQSNNTLLPGRNITFFSLNPTASVVVYPIKNSEVGTDFDYQYNPPVGPYANPFNRFLWNAYVGYKVLPKKNLEWRFTINDMLNQNKGYERNSTNNFNTERNFMTLGRYWMVSMIWNFNTGPMANASSGGPKMRMHGGGSRRGGGPRRR